jgi:hypothetical protein
MVIACTTRHIVSAPANCRYAALSYVWGKVAETSEHIQGRLPDPAPLTIEDALACTQALELDFLWVDRYCIKQDDTKHTMIQNMDRIYNDATITLIDGAGSNSESGLRGVSRTPRRRQTKIKLGEKALNLVPNVKSEINSSKWASRGWTYQEALLSRRRLVFTRSQIYFQCLEMHCCESVTVSMEAGATWADTSFYTDLQVFPRGGKHMTDASEVTDRLREYLRRELTYPSDTLNAFAGVLRRLWYSDDPVYHIWGLPFQPNKVLKALLWMPEPSLGPRLDRKDMFPSWTWAAWRYIPGLLENDCVWPDQRFDVTVEVETTSGELLTIDEYISSMTEKSGRSWL